MQQYIDESLFSLTGTVSTSLVAVLRHSMRDFLEQVAEEWSRFPQEAGQPVWNLVVDDRFATAPYLVAVLLGDERTIVQMGLGTATDLIAYAESRDFERCEEIPGELAERFSSALPYEVSTSDFRRWCYAS